MVGRVLVRMPYMPRRKSWLLVHVVHRDVYKLARAADTECLLRLLDDASDPAEDTHFSKRAIVATALGELRTRAAVPRLAPLVDRNERWDVRISSAIALSRIGGPEAEAALRPAMYDEKYAVKRAAIEGASLEDPQVLATLAELAKSDNEPFIRQAALEALGRTKSEDWIPLFSAAAAADETAPALQGLGGLAGLQTSAADTALRQLRRTSKGWLMRVMIAYGKYRLAISPRARRRRRHAHDDTPEAPA